MTPDRRLDQLEPLMADSLQKIDRLIEGQGKLVELATNTDQKVDVVDRKADKIDRKVDAVDRKVDIVDQKVDVVDRKVDTVVKGVADLTVSTQRQFSELTVSTQRQYEELKPGQEAIMQFLREKLP
ncbi:hypothetical protein [Spirosoma endophyticum]|uniref:t-SNARE coiled-coil homology domain-containing protein n=1 Tax=Spirosoma endophyticum TaxID=662367 RepID=A0A1I1VI41_9BACT|nr:hypothetical protein [Spirosoma endophyticum]SFD82626.1 hypothetical protein SAMN05216167_107196 [Spirosoma endophyticum]